MTDEFRDAVANATDAELSAVIEPWMQSDELRGIGWNDITADDHLAFLHQLRDLSQRIRGAGQHLYLYWME